MGKQGNASVAFGLVIATGISIGTLFTLFVVPSIYMLLAEDHLKKTEGQATS